MSGRGDEYPEYRVTWSSGEVTVPQERWPEFREMIREETDLGREVVFMAQDQELVAVIGYKSV